MAKYEIFFVVSGARSHYCASPQTELVWADSGADAVGKLYQRHEGQRVLHLDAHEILEDDAAPVARAERLRAECHDYGLEGNPLE
jgi:hypothetical protein